MFFQVTFLDESVFANVALPWFLAPVEHEVVFQVGLLHKTLSAQMTSEVVSRNLAACRAICARSKRAFSNPWSVGKGNLHWFILDSRLRNFTFYFFFLFRSSCSVSSNEIPLANVLLVVSILQVKRQDGLGGGPGVAPWTGVTFAGLRVRRQVPLHVALLVEAPPTDVALERLLLGMGEQVPLDPRAVPEHLAADVAALAPAGELDQL